MADKDLYSISDLRERYGLSSKQSIYDRMKALNIEPVAWGKVSGEQLEKLDKLNEHLRSGGKLSNFSEAEVAKTPDPMRQNQSETSLTIGELTRLIEAITSLSFANAPIANPPEPLQALKELESMAEKGRLLANLMANLQIPPKEPTTRLTVELPESMHKKLSILAAKTGRKKAEIVRLLLDEALKEVEE